jgi:hypothetical protein
VENGIEIVTGKGQDDEGEEDENGEGDDEVNELEQLTRE